MIYKTIFPAFIKQNKCVFNIWAPKAKSMELLIQGQEPFAMNRDEYGFWSLTAADVNPGARYKYRINEKDSFPDPASLSQPDGVHEASEAIDLKDFKWTDDDWKGIPLQEMIQYELHTGTFSFRGDFEGIAEKLDYLKDLGINTIELLPVAQFSGVRNWGYDGVYPFAVQNSYGGAKELMALVNECHNRGIAVIMDVVYNHLGPEGNYTSNFGTYFTDRYSTPWGQSINFDGEYSDGVRNYFIQNALMWCRDFHMDGLRLDAVHAIFDFGARHIMQELAENIALLSSETGRQHYLIAESHLNDVRYISPVSRGGYGLGAQWSDDFHHAIHTLVTGEKKGYYMDFGAPHQLSKAMKDVFVFDGKYSEFRKKTYGNSTQNNPGEQFVIFSQNHDQVGNRLHGERLISLTDFETAKVVAGALFLAPNIPMLFMGEEYGERNPFNYFVSHLDPELNRLVREGRKKEFIEFYADASGAENPDAVETYEASKLSWNIENDREKRAMFEFYRDLIRLRKNHPVLKIPDKDNFLISEDGNFFTIERWQGATRLIACLNFVNQSMKLKIPADYKTPLKKILDSNDERYNGLGETNPAIITGSEEIKVQERSVVIYSTGQ
jgi:maltooligosyltrehalose trehalohydrolase